MHRILAFLVLTGLLCAVGCAEPGSSADMVPPSEATMLYEETGGRQRTAAPLPAATDKGQSPLLSIFEPRKVIYTGRFSVVVNSTSTALEEAKALAKNLGGYMQNMTQNSITIRIPAEKFNEAVALIEEMGTVADKNISAQDVTEQHVDLKLRLKNARALMAKFTALLARAEKIADILAIEKEMARVQTQIEQLEGKLNALSNRIAYSTISVRFTEIEHDAGGVKVRLPFYWLRSLGVEELLNM